METKIKYLDQLATTPHQWYTDKPIKRCSSGCMPDQPFTRFDCCCKEIISFYVNFFVGNLDFHKIKKVDLV